MLKFPTAVVVITCRVYNRNESSNERVYSALILRKRLFESCMAGRVAYAGGHRQRVACAAHEEGNPSGQQLRGRELGFDKFGSRRLHSNTVIF